MAKEFTSDWFSGAIHGVSRSLCHAQTQAQPMRILEIGSWEGRSACWFLETFPEATIVCVDTFQGSEEHVAAGLDISGIKGRFLRNTAPHADRVTLLEGHSSSMLYGLEPCSFDCIYVDGSHTEQDTFMDLMLSWGLLKPGGILLVDDYDQPAFPGVRRAVDTFATVYSDRLRLLLREYQIHFLKVA
jgi:predicted O-methyltransferase YrrM